MPRSGMLERTHLLGRRLLEFQTFCSKGTLKGTEK